MKLELQDLHKSFGDKVVLRGVSLEAASGSALGLLGRNGAGKTTSIRILMSLFPPDRGQVLLDGKSIEKSGARIGYLPEERGLYPKKPIGKQLVYLGKLRGLSGKEATKSGKAWLERLSMGETWGKNLDTLSKGNQQKIQLAVCLLGDPDIVILDEPFSGLDPVNAQLLKEVVQEQVAAGKVVLFSSHQMGYVETFCEEIALLHDGEIVLSGNLAAIKKSYPRNRLRIGLLKGSLDEARRATKDIACEVSAMGEDALIVLKDHRSKQDVLAALVASGAPIERFEVLEPSLEEIFVEKAGEIA